MKTIFDPVNRWLNAPPLVLSQQNKAPTTVDDTLTVLKDSGATIVYALTNDYDPEGQPLTLISATAALGTAVAETNGTITYTPPPGISGFDTVVYEIADDLDQRQSGQVNITINDPQVTIDVLSDNTFVVNAASGAIDLTITAPVELAGTYQSNVNDLSGGPINLVLPEVLGSISTGEVLSARDGLWIYDTAAGPLTESWQWLRAGADITGATLDTYTVTPADIGQGLAVRQTLTDSFGQRGAQSVILGGAFTPADDAAVSGWWDASDLATITATAGNVSTWANKVAGPNLLGSSNPKTGTRTLNGLNIMDCSNDAYFAAGHTLPASGNVAFHMVLTIDSVNNPFEAILAVNATNDFQIDAKNSSQFEGRLNAAGIGSSIDLNGGPFNGAIILSAMFDRTGTGQAEIFVSNASRGTTPYTTALDSSVTLLLLTNRSINAWINGAVAELVITENVSNRDVYHAYLSNKWGLS